MTLEQYNKFIEICAKLNHGYQSTAKKDIRRHNKAMEDLGTAFNQVKKDMSGAKAFYIELMEHESEDVRLNAAVHCFGLDINIEQAKKTLQGIIDSHPWGSFDAELCLERYEKEGSAGFQYE